MQRNVQRNFCFWRWNIRCNCIDVVRLRDRSLSVLTFGDSAYGLWCPACREGGNKHCFCPSVCPSVEYIANNSRTQRHSVHKFGRKVPHLWYYSHTSFKVKRYQTKVTRPINAHTHIVHHIFRMAYELQTWCTDGGRRPASAAGAMTSKIKDQGRKVTWSVSDVLAQCCTCVIGRRRLTVSAEPGGHTCCCVMGFVACSL